MSNVFNVPLTIEQLKTIQTGRRISFNLKDDEKTTLFNWTFERLVPNDKGELELILKSWYENTSVIIPVDQIKSLWLHM